MHNAFENAADLKISRCFLFKPSLVWKTLLFVENVVTICGPLLLCSALLPAALSLLLLSALCLHINTAQMVGED